jgi:hypothetical protein
VISQLEARKYPRLARDHRVQESERSYRYLTDMAILTLTNDKIAELESEMEKCKMIYDEYLNTPIKNIWLKELDELSNRYEKWYKEWEEEVMDDKNSAKKSKSRKSNKNKDDGDDETEIKVTRKRSTSTKDKNKTRDKSDTKKVVRRKSE